MASSSPLNGGGNEAFWQTYLEQVGGGNHNALWNAVSGGAPGAYFDDLRDSNGHLLASFEDLQPPPLHATPPSPEPPLLSDLPSGSGLRWGCGSRVQYGRRGRHDPLLPTRVEEVEERRGNKRRKKEEDAGRENFGEVPKARNAGGRRVTGSMAAGCKKTRWSEPRYRKGVVSLLDILKKHKPSANQPLTREELREEAEPLIKDNGLREHLLGCINGMLLEDGTQRVCRRYDANGTLIYWLESAELEETRKAVGVNDCYWLPPPRWEPGDPISWDACAEELFQTRRKLKDAYALIEQSKYLENCRQISNLLQIAIYNISYMRGLFHEKYFSDKSIPELEMKIKKLRPMDAESRRLIDWVKEGVYDAMQKKYLKTLLFCICEKEEGPMIEEYAFSFSYPNTSSEEVAMNMSHTGSKKGSTTFTSNASEVTPDQMRSSACKMIRTLVSLMGTLDTMPEERTILMKLLYYDDVTPEDYEPPFFKCCADNEAINICNKNPLKMEVGNVNSKNLVLALEVKSVLDPCDDKSVNRKDDGMSVDNESDHDDDFSDTEVHPSKADRYIIAPNDDTQDAAHEEELTSQVKEWICTRDNGTINVSDVLSNFPDTAMELIEDIMERLLKDGVLSRASKDGYTVNQKADPRIPHIKKEVIMPNVSPTEGTKHNSGDLLYMKALYHALPMDYVTIAQLQGKMDGEANHNTVRKLIDKMVQDGYVKNATNRRLGKAVIHSESTNRKLLEIKGILEASEGEQMAIDTNAEHAEPERKDLLKAHEVRDGSTTGCVYSVGSDLTRTRELPELQQKVSMQSGQEASAVGKDPSRAPTIVRELAAPVCSLESGVLGQRIKRSLTGGNDMQSTQDKLSRKVSMVKEPILQHVKCQHPQVQ